MMDGLNGSSLATKAKTNGTSAGQTPTPKPKVDEVVPQLCTPTAVQRDWNILWWCIANSMPEDKARDIRVAHNIQQAILSGHLHCWELVAAGQEKPRLCGAALTTVREDTLMGTKSLLVYAIGGLEVITMKAWEGAFQHLADYAKAQGCDDVVALTNNARVLQIAEKLNFDTQWRMLRREV